MTLRIPGEYLEDPRRILDGSGEEHKQNTCVIPEEYLWGSSVDQRRTTRGSEENTLKILGEYLEDPSTYGPRRIPAMS